MQYVTRHELFKVVASISDPSNKLPVGGTTGQVLAKIDGTDFNAEWVDQTGGSGTGNSYNPAGW
jgi:hypothetical protein